MDFTNENNLIENQECSIFYSGDLYRKNSDRVFIVYGFGNNWDHTTEKEMLKQENGFLAKIRMLQYNNIHFCFRNSNYEWDNNNSANYTLPILEADKNTVQETNLDSITTTKNELLNNILEESNVALNYVQEFDIDALIEEILSPLLEEKLYSFDDADIPETKVNETVTTLLNEELSKNEPLKETIPTVSQSNLNTVSEFSMSDLIEDLKNEIIETTSSLISNDTKNTSIEEKTIDSVNVPTVSITPENIENAENTFYALDSISEILEANNTKEQSLEDDSINLSSIIVDELLEDITQIFADSELTNVEETKEPTISGNTVVTNKTEQSDNNDDDDNNITPLNINDEENNYYDETDQDIDELDIDTEDTLEESEDITDEVGFDPTAENDFSDSAAACTALTVRSEDRFVICSRKLTKFYMIRKKIKLALYKVFFAIPRMIKREFNTNNSQN